MTQENSNCENENVAAAKADVDDELYPGELYYPEIDGKIACTCFQCGIEYILENNVKGDEIEKHILCRRHLEVSKCAKCGKLITGLGTFECTDKLAWCPPRYDTTSYAQRGKPISLLSIIC